MVTYLLIGWRHYDVIGWRHRVSRGVKIADASGPGAPLPLYSYTISEKGIRFWHPDYDTDRAQKLISSSMSRHLLTHKNSSKSIYAFLSNLANRQTDRQTDKRGQSHIHPPSSEINKTRNATQPKGDPQIYLRPCVTLTFDPLHPSCCCDTIVYGNMCLPCLVEIRRIVFEIFDRKRFLWLISVHCDLDLWSYRSQVDCFMHIHARTTCANLHRNLFIRFQNIVFTS